MPAGDFGVPIACRRSAGKPAIAAPLGAVLLVVSVAAALSAWDLRPATLATYDRYIALTEARLANERAGRAPFLWLDRQSAAVRGRLLTRLQRGEVVVEPLEMRDGGQLLEVPDGLIHHWIGTVWMPGVSLDQLVRFVQDYDRYPSVFQPMIVRSQVLDRSGDRFVVAMRTSVKKVITIVMDGDYQIEYQRLGPNRYWTTNVASHLHQVNEAGTPSERRVPGDQASGYLWRFRMYCGFEERPDGTLDQCESVTLTRGIPFGVGWFVRPFVTGIPRDTLEFTLGQVRAALIAH